MQQALGRNITLFSKGKKGNFVDLNGEKTGKQGGGSQILGWMHARGGGGGGHSDAYCVQQGVGV